MDPFRFLDRILRPFRKKTVFFLAAFYLLCFVLGACLISQPAVYEYHAALCARFVDRVCFSDTSVFLLFLERTAGCLFLLILILGGGIHPVMLFLPIAVLAWRAYTFGGSLLIFFQIYGGSGAMIVIFLYFPVHLLVDAILVIAACATFGRVFHFCPCRAELEDLLIDLAAFGVLVIAVCLLEAVLLFALFHPLGNLL